MTKNELLELPKKKIMELCKEANLPRYKGKNELSKEEMVDSLLENCDVMSEEEAQIEQVEKSDCVNSESNKCEDSEVERKPWGMVDKTKYIDELEPGVLVAFYDNKGKPRTGKFVNRSSKKKIIKLVTEFGWEFIVPYENVLWIRFGNRWPKGVYKILKEYNKNGKETSDNKTTE